MFTGLVEAVGRVAGMKPVPGGWRLAVETSLAREVRVGDSVAVNGVCLTMVDDEADMIAADIGPETARVTTLGSLAAGSPVNLERSMRGDARFGGHFVQGHVDGLGTLLEVRPEAEFTWMTFAFAHEHAAWLIPKGAVAVDGISLTVAALHAETFDVQVIPHTWLHTNLASLAPGARVNLEFDLIGKYVARAVELAAAGRGARP